MAITGVCCQWRTDTVNLTMTCFATEQQPPIRYQQGEEKDSINENDRVNGLRMKNNDMKEKRFSFFLPTRKKEKRKADPHLAHCLLPDTQANASQKSKSQILQTHTEIRVKYIFV